MMYSCYTKEKLIYLLSFYSYFTFISVLSIPITHEPTQEDILLYSLKLLAENQTGDIERNSYGSIFHPENDLNFYLYTKNSINQYEELKTGDVKAIKNSKFNFSLPTIIAVHGWLSSGATDFCGKIKDAYLNSEEVNVITVSWPAFRPYTLARLIVKPVAKNVAKFLDFLVSDVGVNKSTIHLMGHSLGAHIAGIAGQNMKNGPLLWITGFDPAGPLFKFSDTDGRLDPSDAEFVDVIHTSAGYLGFSQQIGHLDFYPNGGTPVQPGCGFDLGICSHSRSYDYYIESLTNKTPFLAVPCDSYTKFARGQCCTGVTNMGYNVDKLAKGKYYLLTNNAAPFALGTRSIGNPCVNNAKTVS